MSAPDVVCEQRSVAGEPGAGAVEALRGPCPLPHYLLFIRRVLENWCRSHRRLVCGVDLPRAGREGGDVRGFLRHARGRGAALGCLSAPWAPQRGGSEGLSLRGRCCSGGRSSPASVGLGRRKGNSVLPQFRLKGRLPRRREAAAPDTLVMAERIPAEPRLTDKGWRPALSGEVTPGTTRRQQRIRSRQTLLK